MGTTDAHARGATAPPEGVTQARSERAHHHSSTAHVIPAAPAQALQTYIEGVKGREHAQQLFNLLG